MSEAFGGVSYMDYRLVGGLLLGRVYVIKCLCSMNAGRDGLWEFGMRGYKPGQQNS